MGFPLRLSPSCRRRFSLALAWLLFGAAVAGAQPRQAQEYEVKAAYLYNFARFTDWPPVAFPTDDAPLVVAVLGESPFGSALDALAGKPVKGRPLQVRRARRLDELPGVHLLFISDSERGRLPVILQALAGRPVLTVADVPHFARQGGMIQLVSVEGVVRFEINRGAALRAGLELSSRLLQLATLVGSEEEP